MEANVIFDLIIKSYSLTTSGNSRFYDRGEGLACLVAV